jgi:hypothetical protein
MYTRASSGVHVSDASIGAYCERMFDNATRTDPGITGTIAAVSRRTRWRLIDELPLRFDAHHPQGMARVGTTWWISTVDVDACRGYVLASDHRGELVARVSVGDEWRYHPGGMDFDGEALWIAAAEYRPDSTATIYRMVPGAEPERAFDVSDHVGAVARCGAEGDLVGWSWGSRRFYRWTVDGTIVAARINPTFFVDHQDCQWLDSGHLLCGGVAEVQLASGPGWLGGLGLLDVDDLVMQREVPFPMYSPSSERVATHNPIWSEVRDDQLLVHLLPDDGRSTILTYATDLIRTR